MEVKLRSLRVKIKKKKNCVELTPEDIIFKKKQKEDKRLAEEFAKKIKNK